MCNHRTIRRLPAATRFEKSPAASREMPAPGRSENSSPVRTAIARGNFLGSVPAPIAAWALFVAFAAPAAGQIYMPRSSFGMHPDQIDNIVRRMDLTDIDAAFPTRPAPEPVNPKVSIDELRHPLTDRARRILAKAYDYSQKADHARAVATLREGMAKVPALVPYAHGLLGIEYLRLGQNAEAMSEFTEATRDFPHDASVHSNFAVCLCMAGDFGRAEQEARLALYLDPTMSSAEQIVRILEQAKSRKRAQAQP